MLYGVNFLMEDENQKILSEARRLKKEIQYHADKYYNDDNPEIEDWEYDNLKIKLRNIVMSHPEILKYENFEDTIGGVASDKFAKVHHKVKMESLHDSFSIDEVKKFYDRIQKNSLNSFVVEPKIDGISLSVEYVNGQLYRISTRGDGITGEDVTHNVHMIKNLPRRIKSDIKYLEVRGECFLSKSDFRELNKFQDENGQKIFKNPRNAAAGSIRQKDSENCKSRNLKILFFNVQQIEDFKFETHSKSLEFISKIGLPTVNFQKCSNFEDIKSAIENIGKSRFNLPFQIDGAVIKVDSLEQRNLIGSTSSFPKWAEAFKYPPDVKKTKCLDIKFSVGRMGTITPVAIFEPIEIEGSTVSKASLHNEEFVKSKKIHIGDTIHVIKAGDIIPEVIKSECDSNNQTEIKMPDLCPSCNEKLSFSQTENGRIFRCLNPNCFEKIKSQVIHFSSRDAMDINNFGEEVFNVLKNEIKNYSDIYKLNEETLKKYKEFRNSSISDLQELIPGFNNEIFLNKIGKNLLQEIKNSKNRSLERLIYGMGIPFVGKEISKILAKEFKTMRKIQALKKEDLLSIEGIGEVISDSIVEFFDNETNNKNIDTIVNLGVNTKYISLESSKFRGLSFAITGKFSKYSRNDLTEKIEILGGKVNSSVTKGTSYLICGENSGKKLEKAEKLGINIIYEEELDDFFSNFDF